MKIVSATFAVLGLGLWIHAFASVADPTRVAQADGGHESHHGAAQATAPSLTTDHGDLPGSQAGGAREHMGAARAKPLFSQMLDAEGASPAQRARLRAHAQQLIRSGTERMTAGLEGLNGAVSSASLEDMRNAAAEVRQGTHQFEAGVAALAGLMEGSSPRLAAIRWFKEDLDLLPPANPAGSALGLSLFHGITMIVIAGSLGILVWTHVRRSKRASLLAERLTNVQPLVEPATREPMAESPQAVSMPRPSGAAELLPSKSNSWTGLLRVGRIFEETPSVRTLRLVDPQGAQIPFRFLPGQFLTVTVMVIGETLKRSYTIASSPTRPDYCEISVKREERGTVSNFLHHVHEADTLQVTAPSGIFTFIGDDANSVVLISGGVGITPMMSKLRYLTDRCWSGDIYFVHGCRSDDELIFAEELQYLARRYSNVHIHVAATEVKSTNWPYAKGFITRDTLLNAVPHIQNRRIHLCGPNPMLEAMRSTLADLGVPPGRIKSEVFIGRELPKPLGSGMGTAVSDAGSTAEVEMPATPVNAPDDRQVDAEVAVVTFARSRRTALLTPTKSVLEASEDVGVNIDYSCRVGVCGVCKVKLLAGTVSMEVEDGLTDEDRRDHLVLACQAKSSGDVSVDA
ncbi:MAG: 2Fe-2S iron-sulfur cluster-binding protein [Pseudomonadales bacterium]